MLELLAERFKALGEPARLQLILELEHGEKTVSELVLATGLAQANASRHLQILYAQGFVIRRKSARRVVYALADPVILQLCTTMYERIESHIAHQAKQLLP